MNDAGVMVNVATVAAVGVLPTALTAAPATTAPPATAPTLAPAAAPVAAPAVAVAPLADPVTSADDATFPNGFTPLLN